MKKLLFFIFLLSACTLHAQTPILIGGMFWTGWGIEGDGTEPYPIQLAVQPTNTLLGNGPTAPAGANPLTYSSEFEIVGTNFQHTLIEEYTEYTSTSSPITLNDAHRDNLVNQGGTQATFTIELPASPDDGDLCYITFVNAVTLLTIDGNGTSISGVVPTTAAIGDRITLKFYTPASAWICLKQQ